MRIMERHRDGELTMDVTWRQPAPARARQRNRTRTETLEYKQNGSLVAICHRYQQRIGGTGASGLPDPKWLIVGNEIWETAHADSETCSDCAQYQPLAESARIATLAALQPIFPSN